MHKQSKEKNKLDFTESKNFCASKDAIKKVKRQPIEWDKLFANHVSDEAPVFRMYKEHLELNKKTNNLTKKWSNDLNRHSSKENILCNSQ